EQPRGRREREPNPCAMNQWGFNGLFGRRRSSGLGAADIISSPASIAHRFSQRAAIKKHCYSSQCIDYSGLPATAPAQVKGPIMAISTPDVVTRYFTAQ